jgi:hypothetical protein
MVIVDTSLTNSNCEWTGANGSIGVSRSKSSKGEQSVSKYSKRER